MATLLLARQMSSRTGGEVFPIDRRSAFEGRDEVAADTVLTLLADDIDLQPRFERSGEEATNAVRLPIGGLDDLGDGGAVLPAEQSEHNGLLGRGLGRRCGSFAAGACLAGLDRLLGHDGLLV